MKTLILIPILIFFQKEISIPDRMFKIQNEIIMTVEGLPPPLQFKIKKNTCVIWLDGVKIKKDITKVVSKKFRNQKKYEYHFENGVLITDQEIFVILVINNLCYCYQLH